MYLLYLDESGVPETHPSQTTHYVLLGMAVYEGTWFALEKRLAAVRRRWARGPVDDFELHAGWLRRPYPEQATVPGFEGLGVEARYAAVSQRRSELRANWPNLNRKDRKRERKYQRLTEPYAHLTLAEREQVIDEALQVVGTYRRGVTLFAEAIDKTALPPTNNAVDQAFTQVVTRFERFLARRRRVQQWGLLVMDHNQSTAKRFTAMLHRFQRQGARWGEINHVVEAPFFVDSGPNSGVQATDLCAYALRRYLENDERARFEVIHDKFDRTSTGLHGLRHYTAPGCPCMICRERGHDPR